MAFLTPFLQTGSIGNFVSGSDAAGSVFAGSDSAYEKFPSLIEIK